MNERMSRLEAAVDALQETAEGLEARLTRLEGAEPAPMGGASVADDGRPRESLASDLQSPLAVVLGTPALIGRSLLVLAGAFLLRALTEGGTLAPAVGVASGVAYAAMWMVVSSRASKNGARLSGVFYAACSALIAGPLLFEAVTSFNVVSPTAGVVVLALMVAGGLMASARWRLQWAAWIYSILGMTTAAAIATVRPPGEAATAFLVLLGLAALWLAEGREWSALKWATAIAADLAVLRLTAIAVAPGARPDTFGPVHPTAIASLQVALVVGYVGTAVFRALRGQQKITQFDFAQTALAVVIGWGGGMQLARAQGWGTVGLSVLAVVVGVAAYFGAFGVVDRLQGRNRAFFFLSSVGLGLVLISLPGAIGSASAVVWSILALAVAAVGSRWDRVTLRVHAAVFLIAAWVASGVGTSVALRLAGGAGIRGGSIAALVVGTLTVVATSLVVVGRRRHATGWVERLPLAAMLGMAAFIIASVVTMAIGSVLGQSTAIVAGTVALSLTTVGLAFMASRGKVSEAGWLVYPFLVLTGLRMMAVDLSSGHTLVLVIALAAYGAALIVSTWLLRKARGEIATE